MNQFEALVSLNMVAAIGSTRLKKLLEFFGKPQNILNAPADRLMMISGIGEKIAGTISTFKEEALEKELKEAGKQKVKIITFTDAGYPENLKQIYDPPIVLYVKGTFQAEDSRAIAVVGSRRASYYGLSCAEKFASDLSRRGFTVVSGMARGIDTYAHQGALKAGGRTIAVMGSGFNQIYPPENKDLAGAIARACAVVSEFPMDEMPLPQNFPRRNRVISGLSLGVLIVEAARNSGALITADFALEQGREVFALPGKVDSRHSFGTNGLIKQGAKLVSCAQDIVEEFDTGIHAGMHARMDAATETANRLTALDEKETPAPALTCDETILYHTLSRQPISMDDILEKTHLTHSTLAELIVRLQLKKLIRQLPGKQFIRN
jgi:DNA processing protein